VVLIQSKVSLVRRALVASLSSRYSLEVTVWSVIEAAGLGVVVVMMMVGEDGQLLAVLCLCSRAGRGAMLAASPVTNKAGSLSVWTVEGQSQWRPWMGPDVTSSQDREPWRSESGRRP
jgi:hypothetical protein